MDLIDPKQPPEAMVKCTESIDYHRNDVRCYHCAHTFCACGQAMTRVAGGGDEADEIWICWRCHKIHADGWKWG